MQSAETRLGADCGSDHEFIVKFRLKLKKEGKTNRPFRYDLNQYSGNNNKIQGIRYHRQSAWRNMDKSSWHFTGDRDQDDPQEKEMQTAKWLSKEA